MFNRNYKCRITEDITIKGYKALVMENELLRITILLDKGCDIYEFLYKPKDIDFAWRSPTPLQDPKVFVPPTGNDDGTFLDRYEGGFQEILPNGGPNCKYKGINLGQHGELANVPFSYCILKNDEKEISVKFSARTLRTPFYLEKTYTLLTEKSELFIEEKLTNESPEEMELMWGHHPAIGEPFLSEDCIIKTSAQKIFTCNEDLDFPSQRLQKNVEFNWPLCKDNDGKTIDFSIMPKKFNNTADMVYLKDFGNEDAFYEVFNTKLNVGFGMKWDKELFKYIWLWQVCNGSYGYPWYGRTYNLAMEPWTSYPTKGLLEAIKNKSAISLKGYEILETKLSYFINSIV